MINQTYIMETNKNRGDNIKCNFKIKKGVLDKTNSLLIDEL